MENSRVGTDRNLSKKMGFSQTEAVKDLQGQFGASPTMFTPGANVYRKKAAMTDAEKGLLEAKRYVASLPMYF